jgi:outer membrane scaffolding protein for murein synthesis (MipA/OmpV family)
MRRAVLAVLFLPLVASGQELGAGLRSRPLYDGADRRSSDLVPVVRYYGKPWFARTTQGILEGGARIGLGGGLEGGAQLAYEAGPRDGDPGASAGVHLELDTQLGPAPVNLLGRTRTHLESRRGSEADLRLTLGVFEGAGLQAGVFGQATWADAKHLREYYDVRGGGLLFASVGALASYAIGPRWRAVASVERRRLGSEPARSRFVDERTNTYLSGGVAYRF